MTRWPSRRVAWSRWVERVLSPIRGWLRRGTWFCAWTPTGHNLRPLWDRALLLGHQPQPWGLLFERHATYRVYWTRCRACHAAGRLTVTQIAHTGPPHIVSSGPLFIVACPIPRIPGRRLGSRMTRARR